MAPVTRRDFLGATATSAAALGLHRRASAADDPLAAIRAEVKKRHDEGVVAPAGLGQAALDRGREPRHERGLRAHDAARPRRGLPDRERASTPTATRASSPPSTRAPRGRVGLYFMYDVKQVDPSEWSSPPFAAALVDKPGFGKVADGPRGREPEGPRGRVPRRAARDPRRGAEAAREPRARGRERGGDRLAALPAGDAASPR